jgi:thioredoxin-related protein
MSIDAPGGISGTTYAFLRLDRLSDSEKVAKKVLRAVEQNKEVVVFFRNPRALDDKATAESIKYLDAHAKKLVVFTDDVEHTRSYGRLLENLGVTQAPAIVFINRRGTASLVEGYVDGPSLVQVIADAR